MVALTRRALLARATKLAPLAAAAGMLGRFAVPAAQPVEQELLPETEPIYGWWQVMIDGGKVVFHDIPRVTIDERGVWQYPEGALGRGIALAERNVLVRDKFGALVRWGLDTGPRGWPVSAP